MTTKSDKDSSQAATFSSIMEIESNRIGIYFMRHGETEANSQKIIQGQELDSHLSEIGIKQAIYTGKYLKTHGSFDAIYTSPLKRAASTAQLIALELPFTPTKIVLDDRLKESKHGKLSGKTQEDIKKDLPEYSMLKEEYESIEDQILKKRVKPYYDAKMKEIVGAEPHVEVEKRVLTFFDEIVLKGHKRILVVSHSTISNVLLQSMFRIDMTPYGKMAKNARNAYISYIEYDIKEKKFYLVSSPSNYHL